MKTKLMLILPLNEKGFRILKFKKDKPVFEVQNISKSYDGSQY